MANKEKTIVIVDGYSTARELVAELNRLNAKCIHVRSTENPPERLSQAFDPTPYHEDMGYLGHCKYGADVLADLHPAAIVAGSEPGVEYAEQLAHIMNLPTNDPAKAKARRNKYSMGQQIASAGLLCAQQKQVSSVREAIAWAAGQAAWPIVIKPLDSAGSDGVAICHSEEDVRAATVRTIGRENLLGFQNHALLAQTFLDGPQYLVNTVSLDGHHRITDAWLMRGRDVPGHANAMEDWILADPEDAAIREMFAYTRSALTALGFQNGAAVSELKLTRNGPALIETGARLNGPTMERQPYLDAGLLGTQATALAQSLVEPEKFSQNWSDEIGYSRSRSFAKSFFIFSGNGTIQTTSGLSTLEECLSWHSMFRPLSAGDRVAKTADTVGRGGVVYWIHDDQETVLSELKHFRTLDDANRLYEVGYD